MNAPIARFAMTAGSYAALLLTPLAASEPVVLSWPDGVTEFDLAAFDPALPDVEFSRAITDPGPGVGEHWHPFLMTPDLFDDGCNPPQNRIEFTERFDYQRVLYGDQITSDLPEWESAVYCFEFETPWWGIAAWEDFSFACGTGTNGCPVVARFTWPWFVDPVQVVPLRFENDAGDWNYGWFAFRVIEEGLPGCNACEPDQPLRNDSWVYIGFGYETDPDTPIIAGGGLCESDLNADAVLDLADVQLFAQAFIAAEGLADINHDGIFDLADIQRFVGSFNTGCGL